MTAEQNLASTVNDYITQAKGLEKTRQALVDRIRGVVKAEIIPTISPLLPPGYSINPDQSQISGFTGDSTNGVAHNSVPTGFNVTLRLYYDGKQRFPTEEMQRDLEPKLEELAQKYNLGMVYVTGPSARL